MKLPNSFYWVTPPSRWEDEHVTVMISQVEDGFLLGHEIYFYGARRTREVRDFNVAVRTGYRAHRNGHLPRGGVE